MSEIWLKITDVNGNISWCSKTEYELRQKWAEERQKDIAYFMWHGKSRRPHVPKEDDNVKYAWVKAGDKRHIIGVDNKTLKGYAMEPPGYTWKLPLEEFKYDTFERWCTSFDL